MKISSAGSLLIFVVGNLCFSISPNLLSFNKIRHPATEHISWDERSVFCCPLERGEAALAVEYSLNFLFAYITAYSRQVFLSMDDFERKAPIIGQELDRITTCVERTPLHDSFILKRLRFVTLTYSTNLESAGYLHYYVSNVTSQQLLRSIIWFNLYLLSLHDSSGASSLVGHEQDLSRSRAVLAIWGDIFDRLTDLPLGISALFESQYSRALNTLSYLTSFAAQSK